MHGEMNIKRIRDKESECPDLPQKIPFLSEEIMLTFDDEDERDEN